jgi:hypothetical protein
MSASAAAKICDACEQLDSDSLEEQARIRIFADERWACWEVLLPHIGSRFRTAPTNGCQLCLLLHASCATNCSWINVEGDGPDALWAIPYSSLFSWRSAAPAPPLKLDESLCLIIAPARTRRFDLDLFLADGQFGGCAVLFQNGEPGFLAPKSTQPECDFDLAKQWVSNCLNYHGDTGQCAPPETSWSVD